MNDYWGDDPTLILSGGPDRVIYDDPDPKFVHRPVGFKTTATGVNGEQDPLPHCADRAQVEPKGAGLPSATATSPPAPVAMPLLWEGDDA